MWGHEMLPSCCAHAMHLLVTLSSCLAGPQLPRSTPCTWANMEGSEMGRKALVPSKVTSRPCLDEERSENR